MAGVGGVGSGQTEQYVIVNPDTSNLDRLDSQLKDHFHQVQGSFSERMSDLKAQIEGTSDPGEKMAMQSELRGLERELSNLHGLIEDIPSGMGLKVGGEQIMEKVEAAIEGLHNRVSDSYAQFGTVENPNQISMGGMDADKIDNLRMSERAAEAVGASSGTDGEVDSGEVDGSGEVEQAEHDMEELVNMLATDPDAFMDELSDLDPEDRNAMMMTVQTQLQQMNQLFQMTSQFSQAMHDTQSAIIQNLRV